ncbi:MAG TPA: sigma factor-like helix-turn-helix DNA-binding protein [Solirubrobacteraceae bacterium]|jgi:hypothetical protein
MTDLDRLPPDQRAVLSLVLERGKSYTEVAEMLGIPRSAVRDRAHGALDALAGETASTRPARPGPSARAVASGVADTPGRRGEQAGTPGAERYAASSRVGGAVLLGGLVVAVVVAVILLSGGGKSPSSTSASTQTTTGAQSTSTATSTSPSSGARPKLDKKLTLEAVEPSLKASGEAYVLSQGSRRAFYVAAQGLPPSSGFFYAVWLYNSPSSSAPLGRSPSVSSSGHLEGGGPLPSNAGDYAKIIVTRETSTHAAHPGPIVLSGAFALH